MMICFILNYELNLNQVKLEQILNEIIMIKDKVILEIMIVLVYCIYVNKENELYLLIMIMYLCN